MPELCWRRRDYCTTFAGGAHDSGRDSAGDRNEDHRHKTDSIFRRYLIVDEELLAQATGAVAQYLEEVKRDFDRPTS
ncbi:MAG TPA: hypothetical protein VEY91_12725 [Candidatus Limnocylindria bacterium]|nr:hypothetical protein [Candidatus Limnocylindria bacterium]